MGNGRLQTVEASHLDHGLSFGQSEWVLKQCGGRDGFFIEQLELPPDLGTVPCALVGPTVGDHPVPEHRVVYQTRGDRAWSSRMVRRALRPTRTVTVIAGPHGDNPCVLYTMFGGPLAPREVGDPEAGADSAQFWAEHALATGGAL